MNYDDICDIAKRLRFGTQEDKQKAFKILSDMDIDSLIDIQETNRMILVENEGDPQLYSAITDLIGYVDTIQQGKMVGEVFHNFLDLFKNK